MELGTWTAIEPNPQNFLEVIVKVKLSSAIPVGASYTVQKEGVEWWYIVVCKSRQLKELAELIDKAGINCYVPFEQKSRRVPRSRKLEHFLVPIWPGRIFIGGSEAIPDSQIKFREMIFNGKRVLVDALSLSLFGVAKKEEDKQQMFADGDVVLVHEGILAGQVLKVRRIQRDHAICEKDNGVGVILSCFHLRKFGA